MFKEDGAKKTGADQADSVSCDGLSGFLALQFDLDRGGLRRRDWTAATGAKPSSEKGSQTRSSEEAASRLFAVFSSHSRYASKSWPAIPVTSFPRRTGRKCAKATPPFPM